MADIASFTADNNATVIRALGALVTLPLPAPVLDTLREELGQLVIVANGQATRFLPDERGRYLLETMGARMFRAGALSHGAAVDHQRAWFKRDADHRKPAGSLDRTHDAERRSRYRGLPEAAAVQAVSAADLGDLAALVAENANLAGLPQPAYDLASKRFLELNLVERYALEARFARRATLADPLPIGADSDAARKQAQVVLDAHSADHALIGIHKRAISDFAAFLGHVFGMPAEDAFQRIAGD